MDYATAVATVVAAALGLIGVIYTSRSVARKGRDALHRAEQAELEIQLQRTALDFTVFVREWGALHSELVALMEGSCIDRFMLLRAWNGRLSPKWATAVFQLRLGDQESISYVHYALDDDYVERLRDLLHGVEVTFQTADLDSCSIRDVYEAEGVTGSHWALIESKDIPSSGDSRAVTYCSFATHGGDPIPKDTVTRCNLIVGRLQGLAALQASGEDQYL